MVCPLQLVSLVFQIRLPFFVKIDDVVFEAAKTINDLTENRSCCTNSVVIALLTSISSQEMVEKAKFDKAFADADSCFSHYE